MSSHPVTLFRQSLTQTLLLTLGLMFLGNSLGLIQGLIEPANEWGYRSFDLVRWASNSLSGSLIAALLALCLPWLLLSWFGEYFYTRSLNRRDLFTQFWGEFLKFWAPLSLLLLGLCAASQWFKYDSGREISWELALFIPWLSLLMALLFVANSQLLRQLVWPGCVLLLWLLTGDGWQIQGWPLGHGLTLLAGLGLLVFLHQQLAQGQQDLSLEVPGRAEDEYQAMQRSWLYRSLNWLGNHSPWMPVTPSPFLWVSRFKLLSGHPYMLYLQLLAAVGLVCFLLSLFLGRAAFENLPMASTLWLLACGIAWGCLLLLPVRLAGQGYWEFFRTRPLPRFWQYAVNWGVQTGFLLVLTSLGTILLWSMPEIAHNLNFGHLGSALLFLWLAGELGVGLLLLMLAFGFALSPTLVPAAAVLLHSQDWPAWALWGSALAFRGWDIWRFQGHFWEPLALPRMRLQRQLAHYLPPMLATLAILGVGLKTQPLAGFVLGHHSESQFGVGSRERLYLGLKALEALYIQAGKRLYPDLTEDQWSPSFQELSLLRGLVQKPHDRDLARQLGENLLQTATSQEMEHRVYFQLEQDSYQREWVRYYLTQAKYWLKYLPQGEADPYLQALIAEAQGDLTQALAKTNLALKSTPHHPAGLMQKARLQWYLLRYQPALETYLEIAQRFPEKRTEAWQAAQWIAIESGQFDKALEYGLRSLQAGYRPGERMHQRYDSPAGVLRALSRYSQGLCPQLPTLMADFERRAIAPAWLPTLKYEWEKECLHRDQRLAQPDNFFRNSLSDGLWLLNHKQPTLAAQAFSGHDLRGFKAEALWQSGQFAAAQTLATEVAEPWRPQPLTRFSYFSLGELHYSSGRSPQVLAHRVLLKLGKPKGLDSGYRVLFQSTHPEQEWPLLAKAYAAQPADLKHLQALSQAYLRVCQAFEAQGMTQAQSWRSYKKLELMLMLAPTLPAESQTAELKAAVQLLKKALYG